MIEVRPIRENEVEEARLIVFKVAFEVFHEAGTLEDSIAKYTALGVLKDMDDIQKNYFENGGAFLVTVESGQIVGTGAIRYLEEGVCELKRMWLLTDCHGRGLGYRMIQELFSAARARGYTRMRLKTDAQVQTRAVAFYRKLGFYDIPRYEGDDPQDIAMEIVL